MEKGGSVQHKQMRKCALVGLVWKQVLRASPTFDLSTSVAVASLAAPPEQA